MNTLAIIQAKILKAQRQQAALRAQWIKKTEVCG